MSSLNRLTVLYLLCIVLFVVMIVTLLDTDFDLKLFVDYVWMIRDEYVFYWNEEE